MELRICNHRGHYRGNQHCDSKTCVCCHRIRRNAFINESEQALYAVQKQGGSIAMLTLTCSNVGLSLADQIEVLNEVKRLLFKRRSIVRFLKEYGHIGNVTSIEPQIDTKKMRFHPHLHIALAFKESIPADELEQWRSEAARMWCEYMQKRKVYAVVDQQHATLAIDGKEAASYVAKGVAQEIGSGYIKQGRKEGSTTWYGLLRMIREADDDGDEKRRAELVELYQKFECGVHGRRLISISPALRELAETVEEPTEETEEAEEDDQGEEVVIQIPLIVYQTMVNLKVSHLAPVLLANDSDKLEAFALLCDAESKAKELRGYENELSHDVTVKIRSIFDGLCDLDVWSQNRALGLYKQQQRARDRLYKLEAS